MAIPKIFISSTIHDLKDIRESLKKFIETSGYEPILSEYGDVFYNPKEHTYDSCLKEIENCQMFVLIIGTRFGGEHEGTEKSITQMEYERAFELKLPIFVLIHKDVEAELRFYNKNKDIPTVTYSVNIKIFKFIEEIKHKKYNNAFEKFETYNDIEIYLKKQWAGMFFNLLQQNKQKDGNNNIVIPKIDERVPIISTKIIEIIGDEKDNKELTILYKMKSDIEEVIKNANNEMSDIDKIDGSFDEKWNEKVKQYKQEMLEYIESLSKNRNDYYLSLYEKDYNYQSFNLQVKNIGTVTATSIGVSIKIPENIILLQKFPNIVFKNKPKIPTTIQPIIKKENKELTNALNTLVKRTETEQKLYDINNLLSNRSLEMREHIEKNSHLGFMNQLAKEKIVNDYIEISKQNRYDFLFAENQIPKTDNCYIDDDNDIFFWADELMHKRRGIITKFKFILIPAEFIKENSIKLKVEWHCEEIPDWIEEEIEIKIEEKR